MARGRRKWNLIMFRLVKKDGLCYYTIDSFINSKIVTHCFTTRHGGVSGGVYESMNLRLSSGDSMENILENYRIISSEIGIDDKKLVLSKQVHEANIADVTSSDWGNGIYKENRFTSADALVTNETGVPLVTFYADCVPVFLLDTKRRVLALVHSGWKGTVLEISRLTIEHMINKYSSSPDDIIAAIGPSISKCHFEVGEEVSKVFYDSGKGEWVDRSFKKPHIDLKGCIFSQLTKVGIKEENITVSDICTYCDENFYSHRRMGDRRGTMAAFAQLI